jgi:tRNA pseudouridine32 synthase/23S rRNA pseudouridine746 synthase
MCAAAGIASSRFGRFVVDAEQARPILLPMEPLHLLYLDEALLVVCKPAGLLAVPGRGAAGADNLTARLKALHADALVVHRLDMATSGLMVFARGPVAQRALSMAFEARRVCKQYEAVVEGVMAGDDGEIDAPLMADWPNRPRQQVSVEHGKPSLTRWRVLQRGAQTTRLALTPVTGRTHQLRVHLQHVGHPIRGDALYAPEPLQAERLLLHATQLVFDHPTHGAALSFCSPAPF